MRRSVDGVRAQQREIVRLLYEAGRFQRRFGNSGIADSGRIVQIGVHRGENIRLVIRRINIDLVPVGDQIVPAGAEHNHQADQQTHVAQ